MDDSRGSTVGWRAVGRRLRELTGFGVNQAAFAREIGVSQAQLSRYEKGKSEIGAEVLCGFPGRLASPSNGC
jgi:transcriptional regulator with XRE-family HTH domain